MGISLGWFVFFAAGAIAAPAAERNAPQISYTVRMVEANGVGWRETVFTRLKPVARQGPATVWTVPRSSASNLLRQVSNDPARTVIQAPRVTALAGAPATIQVRGNRSFVTRASWSGDESASSGTRDEIRVGWHTTLVGRKLDQGVLVKMVIEDTEIRGVHKVHLNSHHPIDLDLSDLPTLEGDSKTARALAPVGSSFDNPGLAVGDAKRALLKGLLDKATTALADGRYLECQALAGLAKEIDPNELAASMLLFKAKAELRYKDDQRRRGEPAENAAVCRDQIKILPAEPFVCGTPFLAALESAKARKLTTETPKNTIELPEVATQEVLGEWLIPNGECLLVSFGPHTVADKDGKAVVRERLAFVEAEGNTEVTVNSAAPFNFIPAPRSAIAPPPPDSSLHAVSS